MNQFLLCQIEIVINLDCYFTLIRLLTFQILVVKLQEVHLSFHYCLDFVRCLGNKKMLDGVCSLCQDDQLNFYVVSQAGLCSQNGLLYEMLLVYQNVNQHQRQVVKKNANVYVKTTFLGLKADFLLHLKQKLVTKLIL